MEFGRLAGQLHMGCGLRRSPARSGCGKFFSLLAGAGGPRPGRCNPWSAAGAGAAGRWKKGPAVAAGPFASILARVG